MEAYKYNYFGSYCIDPDTHETYAHSLIPFWVYRLATDKSSHGAVWKKVTSQKSVLTCPSMPSIEHSLKHTIKEGMTSSEIAIEYCS